MMHLELRFLFIMGDGATTPSSVELAAKSTQALELPRIGTDDMLVLDASTLKPSTAEPRVKRRPRHTECRGEIGESPFVRIVAQRTSRPFRNRTVHAEHSADQALIEGISLHGRHPSVSVQDIGDLTGRVALTTKSTDLGQELLVPAERG